MELWTNHLLFPVILIIDVEIWLLWWKTKDMALSLYFVHNIRNFLTLNSKYVAGVAAIKSLYCRLDCLKMINPLCCLHWLQYPRLVSQHRLILAIWNAIIIQTLNDCIQPCVCLKSALPALPMFHPDTSFVWSRLWLICKVAVLLFSFS